jgi:hypothetical protein
MGTRPKGQDERVRLAQAAVMRARTQLEEAQKQLDRALINYPDQPEDGAVLKFALQFESWGPMYRYAALRVNGRWYTTGHSCPDGGYSWRELIDFIRGAYTHTTKPLVMNGVEGANQSSYLLDI